MNFWQFSIESPKQEKLFLIFDTFLKDDEALIYLYFASIPCDYSFFIFISIFIYWKLDEIETESWVYSWWWEMGSDNNCWCNVEFLLLLVCLWLFEEFSFFIIHFHLQIAWNHKKRKEWMEVGSPQIHTASHKMLMMG